MKKLVSFISFLLIISSQVCAQWQQLNSPVLPVYDMLKLSDGTILIGTGSGLFRSNDNFLSWDSTSVTNNVNLIKKDKFGNIYASVLTTSWIQPGYLFRSTDLGLTWNILYDSIPGIPYNVRNMFINDSGYIFTIQGHGDYPGHYTTALKSTDFGTTWSEIYNFFCACNLNGLSSSIIETFSGTLFLSELLYDYNTHLYHYYIKKKELGSNWTYIYADKFANNLYVYNSELYMATTSIYTSSLGLIKSSDDGNTFVQLNNGFSDLNVQQLILRPEVFIALNDDGIYRSLDEGNNWVRLDHTGLNSNINRIYMDDSNTLYTCTNNGVYVFTGVLPVELTTFYALCINSETQLTWSTESELNNHGFEIERSLDKITWATIGFRAGKGTTLETQNYTFGDDISEISAQKLYYRLKQIDFNGNFEYSKIVEVEITPTEFYLKQNYPNPFNPSTTISWQSPVGSWQTLEVYDILGKEVTTLVDEYRNAGSYEVEFESSVGRLQLASGIYYYQLRAGDFVQSKKMILMK